MATKNPVTNDRWEGLSDLARRMIEYVLYADPAWLYHFVEGEVVFVVRSRDVHSMTPAPSLKPGQGLPKRRRRNEGHGSETA